jgi:hypothetical protein
MSYIGFLPHCAICKQAVNLTESKTDEYGQAVHEDCYVSMAAQKKVHACADYDHPPSSQTNQRMLSDVRHSDDLSRALPTPERIQGGSWY